MYRSYRELAQTPEEKEINMYKYEIIQNKEHKNHILQTNRIVCIEIYGNWCEPCKAIKPKYAELAQKYNKQNEVCICSEDFDLRLTPQCSVVPTFFIYLKGQFVKSIVGGDLNKIEEELLKLMSLALPEQDNYNRISHINVNSPPKNKFQNFHGRNSYK
jgi:thioredoxin 1